MARSIAKACLRLTGLFEAELLTELMLRHWKHPLAADSDYRGQLLEAAAQALRAAIHGEKLFDDLKPSQMNLISAIWYAESVALEQTSEASLSEVKARRKWLDKVRRALPSCFCNPDELAG